MGAHKIDYMQKQINDCYNELREYGNAYIISVYSKNEIIESITKRLKALKVGYILEKREDSYYIELTSDGKKKLKSR